MRQKYWIMGVKILLKITQLESFYYASIRQTPAKKRQNASQPIRWVETAARLGKTHPGDRCFDFFTAYASHNILQLECTFLNLIKIIATGIT